MIAKCVGLAMAGITALAQAGSALEIGWDETPSKDYAIPHEGDWSAVYSREFAERFGLGPERVSEALPANVEYAEVYAARWGSGGQVYCWVNLLARQPNTLGLEAIAKPKSDKWSMSLLAGRKPVQMVKTSERPAVRAVPYAVEFGTPDYVPNKRGMTRSAHAGYSRDVVNGFDYLTVGSAGDCFSERLHMQRTGGQFAVRIRDTPRTPEKDVVVVPLPTILYEEIIKRKQ